MDAKKGETMYRKILVAYNGTPESQSALTECIRLAPEPSAEIHLLAVVMPPAPVLIGDFTAMALVNAESELADARKEMAEALSAGHALLQRAGLNVVSHMEVGDPINVIADVAKKLGIELVIVGHSRHKSWAARWWRGSTGALLIEKVQCSFLIATAAATATAAKH
jgi:nucleotide-binding universal stress UspA family protein